MKSSIARLSPNGALDEQLGAIAAARFARAELFENDLLSCSASARTVERMIDDFGLETVALQPFRDFEGVPARLADWARAIALLDHGA